MRRFATYRTALAALLMTITLGGLGVSSSAFGDCWVVGNLNGYSSHSRSEYEITPDRMSGQTWRLNFAGKQSTVVPASQMECRQITPGMLFCSGSKEATTTIETWSLHVTLKKVVYTQIRSGYGPFDGTKLLVGDIIGSCK